MNIAILHYSVPPIVGGVESVIAHHARLMTADGHSVRLIAARGESLDERILMTPIDLMDSKHSRVLNVKAQLDEGHATVDFEKLRDELVVRLHRALTNIDVLMAHNVCSLHKNLALTAALYQLHSTHEIQRLILWHHDLAWTTTRYQHELHGGYPWDLLRRAWPRAKQVTISEMRQQELAELFQVNEDTIAVIPNGIDAAKFHKLEKLTESYLEQTSLSEASPLLLLPVRITSRKNIELALHALVYLRKEYLNAKIVVTGPLGPHNPANIKYFEKLRDLRNQLDLTDAAYFLAELTDEFIPDEVISDFYHLADALFLPSREEGFGIPILEAGLTGIPVFSSNIPPLKKLGGIHATYFQPDADPQEVAMLIADHFRSSPTFKLRSAVRTNYTWGQIYAERIKPMLMNEAKR